jgi:hypothetical protein
MEALNVTYAPLVSSQNLSIIFYLYRVQTGSGVEQTSVESITGLNVLLTVHHSTSV